MKDYKFTIDPETLNAMVVTVPTAEKIANDVARMIAADFDGKVRRALIDLGWTPPAPKDDAPRMFGCGISVHAEQLAMNLLSFEEPRD